MNNEISFDEIEDDLLTFGQDDDMLQQALHRGVDLKQYGLSLEKELKAAETNSVAQYVENNQLVMDLHKQMQECDGVLARMQEMLLGFQADLGGISEEIKHLQDESLSMSIRLKNRRAAEDKVHRFLENSSINAVMTEHIASPDVNEAFLSSVVSLSGKLTYLQQVAPAADGSSLDVPPADTYVGRSLLPDLEKLKIRAITKARDYFIAQFQALRRPKTNVKMVQQNALVRYAPLLQFVQREAPGAAEDLRLVYAESMGKTLQNLFKSYCSQLLKLDLAMATKNDLIAVEEATLRLSFASRGGGGGSHGGMNMGAGGGSSSSGSGGGIGGGSMSSLGSALSNPFSSSKRADAFALGDRDKILDQIEAEPILLHVALAESTRYPFEAIFRSIVKHLSDAATNEFLFILDFFGKSNLRETFNRIFGRTLSLVLEFLENYLLGCYDAIGLLLVIRVTHMQRLVMQRRRIPVLDAFFDRVSLLLWPRFKHVFELNLKSVKNAQPKKLGPIDLAPHYVSRRYAELVSSVFFLQAAGADSMGVGGGGEHMLLHDIHQMRAEITLLLEKLAQLITNPKEQKVFFINNFDQILSVFQERRVVSDEVQKFEDILMRQREVFAEEEIKSAFPRLVSFVVQTEAAMNELAVASSSSFSSSSSSSSASTAMVLDEGIIEGIVRDFSVNWRSGIQQINDNVLSFFANFRNGMEILKQVLTQLLLYYTRFQDIIKKCLPKAPAFARDIVSTATILMEIKRYSR
jgi:hypothetical protein